MTDIEPNTAGLLSSLIPFLWCTDSNELSLRPSPCSTTNLELWAKAHGAGQRVEDQIRFIVEHYPEATRAALNGSEQLSFRDLGAH